MELLCEWGTIGKSLILIIKQYVIHRFYVIYFTSLETSDGKLYSKIRNDMKVDFVLGRLLLSNYPNLLGYKITLTGA